ncbi:uncharacterized protein LOC135841999 [Planococcus citri]|uniref:uncharacterized protein LOC135841999 n=1 Tax=Planococcus citri TaxID=170843 RepID=UPI0031F8420E
MDSLREVKKLIKQACGQENMFGYQTTLANQLYLMHLISGRTYSTDKLHWHIKLAYFVPNFAMFCQVFIICALYCNYGFEGDLILMTQVAFFEMLGISSTLIIPLASCMFGDGIDTMVELVDRLLVERRSLGGDVQKEGIVNIRTWMIINYSALCALSFVYLGAGTCDIIMFYEEEKVKNYIYYSIPFPYIEEYGSMRLLLFVNLGTPSFIGMLNSITMLSAIAMPLIWAAVCHNEVIHICHDLRASSTPRNIKLVTKSYQRVARIIKNFREFYNIVGTLTLVQVLAMAIAYAYVVLLWDVSYLIKVKGIVAVLISFTFVFQLCAVGETIDNLTNLISQEIYSTRWYDLSTQHRKDILIFLGQAQATFDLSAYKKYPFRLNTVLRFANMVYSAANFLRTITKK